MNDKLMLPTADMWVRLALLRRIELRRSGVARMEILTPSIRERARRACDPGRYPVMTIRVPTEDETQYDVSRTTSERREAWRRVSGVV